MMDDVDKAERDGRDDREVRVAFIMLIAPDKLNDEGCVGAAADGVLEASVVLVVVVLV